MESGLVVLTVVAMIAVGVFIVLMDKAKKAASRALSQKVLYRKKFEQGKHLLEGMTIDAAASSELLLRELQTRVAVSDPPTGLANRLYTAGRQGNRIEYVYGNKFGDSFRARVVILEHGERSLGIFKVIRWHEQEGIIVAQDWMKTLFDQVRAVVVAADPAATFTEGINDARLKIAAAPDAAAKAEEPSAATQPEPALSAESEDAVAPDEAPAAARARVPAAPAVQAPVPIAAPTKQMNTWSYIGMALLAAAIMWIGTVGVPDDLMPVWFLIAGAGGAMVYFSTRAPRAGAVSTGPARPSASEPPVSPSEPTSVLEVPAPAEEPSAEQFELAAEELSVAAGRGEAAAAAPATSRSKLVPRIVMAVAALVIVGIVGGALVSGISKEIDKADRKRAAQARQAEGVAVDVPVAPASGQDAASAEGDTASFVEFVQGEGGSIVINAEPDGERVYSRPSIMMVRSSEPFFEWAIPLSDSYEYSIGTGGVTGYELFEYVCQQELVTVEVACDGGRIVSIYCWDESESVSSDVAYLEDFLLTAPAGGDRCFADVYFDAAASAKSGRIVFSTNDLPYTISIARTEADELQVDGVPVSGDVFVEAISERGGMGSIMYTQNSIERLTLAGGE